MNFGVDANIHTKANIANISVVFIDTYKLQNATNNKHNTNLLNIYHGLVIVLSSIKNKYQKCKH